MLMGRGPMLGTSLLEISPQTQIVSARRNAPTQQERGLYKAKFKVDFCRRSQVLSDTRQQACLVAEKQHFEP